MPENSPQPQDAPTHWGGIVKHLGPGLIITACIVGSGELIGTPLAGADNGFSLLWFIILGCIVKVFVQVELGRAAVAQGKTTLELMDSVPGPRLIVSWLIWCFLVMFICVFFQLGGIVGGVAQVFEQAGLGFSDRPFAVLLAVLTVVIWACTRYELFSRPSTPWLLIGAVMLVYLFAKPGWLTTDKGVALVVSALTVALLASGQYRHVERFSVAMVVLFMGATAYALYALQTTTGPLAAKAITGANIAEGLKFKLPENLGTAFAAFGMIGVGASELIYYPYWCLEKGYSRNIGPYEDTPAWYERARGWLRVMRTDAWLSMAIYTSATVVFFLLGAAMLQGTGVNDKTMIPDLSNMFASLGPTGLKIFLVGAFMVLFSTLVSGSASNARLLADTLVLYKIEDAPKNEAARRRLVGQCCVIIPTLCAVLFVFLGKPVTMVLIGGVAQAFMLVPLSGAALYFRYRTTAKPLQPGMLWTLLLWISAIAMAAVGLYMVQNEIRKQFQPEPAAEKKTATVGISFAKSPAFYLVPDPRGICDDSTERQVGRGHPRDIPVLPRESDGMRQLHPEEA